MDCDPAQIVAPPLDLTCVDSGPNFDLHFGQLILEICRGSDGTARTIESRHDAVAGTFHEFPFMPFDESPRRFVVDVEEGSP